MSITRKRTGILTAETIVAIALVAILLVLLASGIGRQRLASDKLATSRDAVNLAEQTLTALQTGQPAPKALADAKVQVAIVPAAAREGTKWVKVDVQLNGRSTSLLGIVPADAPVGGAK
jgi:type II secretory pathway pseudopilin PulG